MAAPLPSPKPSRRRGIEVNLQLLHLQKSGQMRPPQVAAACRRRHHQYKGRNNTQVGARMKRVILQLEVAIAT